MSVRVVSRGSARPFGVERMSSIADSIRFNAEIFDSVFIPLFMALFMPLMITMPAKGSSFPRGASANSDREAIAAVKRGKEAR